MQVIQSELNEAMLRCSEWPIYTLLLLGFLFCLWSCCYVWAKPDNERMIDRAVILLIHGACVSLAALIYHYAQVFWHFANL